MIHFTSTTERYWLDLFEQGQRHSTWPIPTPDSFSTHGGIFPTWS